MAGWLRCAALGSGLEEFDHAIGCRVGFMAKGDGLPRHVSLGLPAVREALEDTELSDHERAETEVVAEAAISAIVGLEAAHQQGVAPSAGAPLGRLNPVWSVVNLFSYCLMTLRGSASTPGSRSADAGRVAGGRLFLVAVLLVWVLGISACGGGTTSTVGTAGIPVPSVGGSGRSSGGGSGSPGGFPVSAYVDVTSAHQPLDQVAAVSGLRRFVLAFVLSDGGACSASWGGERALDDPGLLAEIAALRGAGGSVAVASGGASGSYLENACGDATSLAAVYGRVLDVTGSSRLDVDVEQDVDVNKVMGALALLEQQRRASVTLTLPVQGAAQGFSEHAIAVLRAVAARRLDVTVNAMVMNFDYAGSWARAMTTAGDTVAGQVRQVWPDSDEASARHKLGLTFMIGANDTGAITTVADATAIARYAEAGGAGSIAFWSINRDNGGCPAGGAQPTCSGISQDPDQFARAVVTAS